jgi:hypothetical protein
MPRPTTPALQVAFELADAGQGLKDLKEIWERVGSPVQLPEAIQEAPRVEGAAAASDARRRGEDGLDQVGERCSEVRQRHRQDRAQAGPHCR